MRALILILWIALGTVAVIDVSAQSTNERPEQGTTHALGLNATGLLDNILNPDSEDDGLPYLITYDLTMGKLILRAAIGPEYSNETIVHEGFTDSQERFDLRLDGRIGVGIHLLNDTHWTITAGIDVTGHYALEETTDDTGFDKVTDEVESQSIGGGPFLRLSYKLSPRISISTEAALYIRRYKTTHTELFENFPDFNNQLSKTTGTVLDTYLPTAIFVHLHF